MKYKIGFTAAISEEDTIESAPVITAPRSNEAKKSVVQIHFPTRNMTLAYYNDKFDLHIGDMVYVDGKLEGQKGRVVDINYNFKIKLSDYKKVLAVVDTDVSGKFYTAGSHSVAFDSNVIPKEKIKLWFIAPEHFHVISCNNGRVFTLCHFGTS